MRRALVCAVLVSAVALAAVPAGAATVTVAVGSDFFSPSKVTRAAGGSVRWTKTDGVHNVYSSLFTSGRPTDRAFSFTRTFSAGTFSYVCQAHALNMRGTVRVAPRIAAAPSGRPFTVTWATRGSNTGSRFDVQYRAGGGSWKTWKPATSDRFGVFGARRSPVRLRAGTSYALRVRSRSGSNVSGWSPARSFSP